MAALVLVGYSEVLRDACCQEAETAVACDAPEPAHSHSDSERGDGDDCYCICHQTLVNEQSSAPLEPMLLTVLSLVLERANHPPDSLPLGIDYPPRLA